MQSQLKFPRHMDAPQRVLFWTVDQIIPFSTMLLIGMLTETLLISLVVGAAVGWGFARFRDSRPDGYLQHLVYWYGLLPLKGRACVNPFDKSVYPQ